jgi:hypothetical protein
MEKLNSQTVAQLKETASKVGLRGYSKMRKEELKTAIASHLGAMVSKINTEAQKQRQKKTLQDLPTDVIQKITKMALPNLDMNAIYTDTGKLYQFDKTITSKGTPISLTDAHGNGLTHYNNYYYVAKDNDIDRFNATTMEREENWYSTLQDKYFIYKTIATNSITFINSKDCTYYMIKYDHNSYALLYDMKLNLTLFFA